MAPQLSQLNCFCKVYYPVVVDRSMTAQLLHSQHVLRCYFMSQKKSMMMGHVVVDGVWMVCVLLSLGWAGLREGGGEERG